MPTPRSCLVNKLYCIGEAMLGRRPSNICKMYVFVCMQNTFYISRNKENSYYNYFMFLLFLTSGPACTISHDMEMLNDNKY